jgi:hypothetical protein
MAAIGAGVLLMCSAASAGFYFLTPTKENEMTASATEAASAAAAEALAAAVAAEPGSGAEAEAGAGAGAGAGVSFDDISGYNKFVDFSFTDTKIGECTPDSTVSACGVKCKYNTTCIGFTYDKNDKTCCLHSQLSGLDVNTNSATYVKGVGGYVTEELGDRTSDADPLQTVTTGIDDCSSICTGDRKCIGFSYIDGHCDLKGSGISGSHQLTGGQFHKRSNYPANLPKARYVVIKMTDTPSKHVIVSGRLNVFGINGKDIASGKPVTASGSHGTSSPQGLTGDGSWHSLHTSGERSAKIDLGSEQTIKYIEVQNGCGGTTVYNGVACNARFSGGGPGSGDKGAYIELLDDSEAVTLTSKDIKHIAGNYILDFTKSLDTWS